MLLCSSLSRFHCWGWCPHLEMLTVLFLAFCASADALTVVPAAIHCLVCLFFFFTTFSFKTFEQSPLLPWGNKVTLAITKCSPCDKVSEMSHSCDTLKMKVVSLCIVRPLGCCESLQLRVADEIKCCWQEKKRGFTLFNGSESVCSRKCEVCVLDVLDVCWVHQWDNNHSEYKELWQRILKTQRKTLY